MAKTSYRDFRRCENAEFYEPLRNHANNHNDISHQLLLWAEAQEKRPRNAPVRRIAILSAESSGVHKNFGVVYVVQCRL